MTTTPKDWKQVKLNEIAFINKESLDNSTPADFKFKYLDLASVNKGRVSIPRNYIEYSNAPSRARRRIGKNNVLMATVRPNLLGHCIINFDPENIICSTGFAVIEAKKNVLKDYFIYSYLFTEKLNNTIRNMLVGSNYPAINSSDVADFDISLPPLPEQEKIVEVLETWDKYLEKLEAFIKNKKSVKKAIVHMLLTGKFRLPQFTHKWERHKLGDFLENYNVKTKIENEATVLTSSRKGLFRQDDYYVGNRLSDRSNKGFNVLPEYYLTYRSRTDDGFFRFNINDIGFTGIISKYYPVFKVVNGSTLFILYLLNFKRNVYAKYCVGTSQLVLSFNSLRKIEFAIPEKEEQTAIANILSTADQEIEALEKKRAIIEAQKKFLLNNLVTGKIRLPEFTNAK